MPSAKLSRIVLLFLILNTLLWIIFWGGFFSESIAYPHPPMPTEGIAVSQVVAHRAIPHDLAPNRDTYYQVSFIPNLPSFLVTRVLFNIATRGFRSPELYLGTTVAGYELICWMVVSFLQWYLIGRAISWLMSRRQQHVVVAAQQ
jgi:hypothetical protein